MGIPSLATIDATCSSFPATVLFVLFFPKRPKCYNVVGRDNAFLHLSDVYDTPDAASLAKEHKRHQAFKTISYEKHKNRNPLRVSGSGSTVEIFLFPHPFEFLLSTGTKSPGYCSIQPYPSLD